MGAPYRLLQCDFSAGQIDRMVEANLNYSNKTIGLKQSLNTIHNINKTVSKRPGTKFYLSPGPDSFEISPDMSKADILLNDGRMIMFCFDKDHSVMYCDGEKYTSNVTVGVDGPYQTAVYQNFLYIVGKNVSLVKILMFWDDNGTIKITDKSIAYSSWTNKPSCVTDATVNFDAVTVSGGRLFLSKGNVYWFSRIRVVGVLEEDSDGFPTWTMDFKLNDVVNDNVYVDSSYAFEGRENDMYSSSIKWMASMGRVIIGTGAGIFMSTTQGIDPLTFDTVQTSSYGTCDIQPELVSNMIFFLSADRRKIFSAYFASDYQGLLVGDVTANVRDMFCQGIRHFWAFDYPELSIFVATDDGRVFFCQPSNVEGGFIFAWSQWSFSYNETLLAVFHERLSGGSEHRICAVLTYPFSSDVFMATVEFAEPYYDDTDRALMDYMLTYLKSEMTCDKNHVRIEGIPRFATTPERQILTVFVRNEGANAPIVIRNLSCLDEDNTDDTYELEFDIPKNVEGFYDNSGELLSTVTITVGTEYEARIGLFQQILPNNSGIALSSKHNIKDISVMVYRSFGGRLEVAGRTSSDLPYLKYGRSSYSADMYDFTKEGIYAYTGVLKITNPRYIGQYDADNNTRDVVEEDNVVLVLDRPFPFNLMAVSIGYIITEVS